MERTEVSSEIDARGLVCPMPTIRLGQAIRKVEIGELVQVWTDDPGSKENMGAWCKNTGHELVAEAADGTTFRYTVRRSR